MKKDVVQEMFDDAYCSVDNKLEVVVGNEINCLYVTLQVPRGEMSFSHPGMAITVAHEVASFQGIPVSKVLQATRKNTKDMYGI